MLKRNNLEVAHDTNEVVYIMDSIVEILIRRDGLTKSEAIDLIEETRELLLTSDPWEADQIMADQLGLEPDYILDIIGL